MKPITLCILFEEKLAPIPEGVAVHKFGDESIIDPDGEWHDGTSMLVTGQPEVLREWFRPHEVWTSTNPMCGAWKQLSVDN